TPRCGDCAAPSYSLDSAIRPFFSFFADPAYTTGMMLEEEISKAEKFLNRPPANRRRHATKVRPQWEWRTVMTTAMSTCELGIDEGLRLIRPAPNDAAVGAEAQRPRPQC